MFVGTYDFLPAKKIRYVAVTFAIVSIVVYLAFSMVSGERGLVALFRLSHNIDVASQQLDQVRSSRIELEQRVKLMRAESLDLDMLDDQARNILGFAHKDDVVYFLDDENN
jgi:cell division protein FtsB